MKGSENMEAKTMEKAKEKFCEEIENAVKKGTMSSGDFETLYKAVIGYEKALKIEEMDDMGATSHRSYVNYNSGKMGNWTANGSYDGAGRRSYDGGDSYDNGGYSGRRYHYVRGHYSRDDGAQMVREKIEQMLDDGSVSGSDRKVLEKAMEIL